MSGMREQEMPPPRVYILSDLHLEFSEWTPDPAAIAAADLIVLAGDIGIGTAGVRWAAHSFPGKPVMYVAGNHEFYGGNISRTSLELQATARDLNITYLDNSEQRFDFPGCPPLRVLGATLWTDFLLFGRARLGDALQHAKNRIADFSHITFGTTGWMQPAQSVILHQASVAWLTERLTNTFDGTTIVVTHHLPSRQVIAERYQDDILSAAFASNLDNLVAQSDMWIFGHSHSSFDGHIGACRIVSNQRGYPGESTGWNPSLTLPVLPVQNRDG